MAEDNRLNLVEGTGINLAKDAQAQTLTIKTTVNNVELTSPNNTIDIHSSVDSETNTKTFTLAVNGGGGTGENIQLQSEDQSLYITQPNPTTFDLSVIPQRSDWAETDSNSATFIQHKPIEVIAFNEGAYSAITTAVNAGKLVMTDHGHVYSKTDNNNNVHYFTKLNYIENEDYPTHYDKANYEIVTVSGDHDWNLNHVGGALITNDFIDYAFSDPIWDKHDFWGQPSIRLKECPLYRYSYIDEHNNEQYNLDIPGQTEVTIQNNKLIVIRDINQPTLDIILYLTHNHVPNFVIETSPNTDCDVTIKATYNSQTEPSPIWETLYYSNGDTSATIISDHYYQIKATGSYWSMTDYGTDGRLWNR